MCTELMGEIFLYIQDGSAQSIDSIDSAATRTRHLVDSNKPLRIGLKACCGLTWCFVPTWCAVIALLMDLIKTDLNHAGQCSFTILKENQLLRFAMGMFTSVADVICRCSFAN